MSTVEDPDDGPDIPEKSWENPFPEGHPLHDLFGNIVRQNRDLAIILDDYHARRGTGKTIASMQLANAMDQNTGLNWEKVAMRPEEIRNAYYQQPPRSGLVLDEGEVELSNRDAMTKTNKALREIVSMGRVEEKYVVINAPSIGFIDKDIRLLADVWITMVTKGIGLVHFLERQPYANQGGGKLLTRKKGMIEFRDIDRGTELRRVYNKLTTEKKQRIRGEEGDGFITKSEHREELSRAKKDVRQETRDEIVRSVLQHPEIQQTAVSQRMVGEAIGVSQSTVNNILQGGG